MLAGQHRGGCFTARDPKGYVDGINRYVYALNDPVNRYDPFGTKSINQIVSGAPRGTNNFDFTASSYHSGDGVDPTFISGTLPLAETDTLRNVPGNGGGAGQAHNLLAGLIGGGANILKGGFNLAKTGINVLSNKNTLRKFGSSIDDLTNAAAQPINKEGLTNAARALTKHAQGQRSSGTFPRLRGGIQQQNKDAQQIVNDILNNPNSKFRNINRGGLEVRDPTGRGIRFNQGGAFDTFLDPPIR